MAAPLSSITDILFTDTKRTRFTTNTNTNTATTNSNPNPLKPKTLRKKFPIYCTTSKSTPEAASTETKKNPSLSEQLTPLANKTLSTSIGIQPNVLSKPKSTWVNPTKPKRSVLSHQRQKRAPYSYTPQLRDFQLFAQKINECGNSDDEFSDMVKEIPHTLTRENALLVLNSLKPWPKTHMFLHWMRTQNLIPMETIFYNVTMKSLRFGRQFQLIEELAHQMFDDGIELDNITYSTIISCAKKCNLFDKAVYWFERMYKTGLMPDEVTYSAILDVYAKLGKVQEVINLYERGRATGWKPDPITFSVLGKMFGEAGDYDGIRYVLQEMKSIGVQPNLVVYNTLLEAMGKAGKPGFARSLFEEMIESGVEPNEKTLTAVIKIYGKARWSRDALELWERMKENGWPMDFILYNTLLNMCADVGLVEEAETLFKDMKQSEHTKPDSYSYTAMLNIYGSEGDVDSAMELFEEMSRLGIQLNVMGCTCLIQCLGKAMEFDDLVRVFDVAIERGVKPDDRLCGSLLSVLSLSQGSKDDEEKVLSCLRKANPKLVAFIQLIVDEETRFEAVKEEFKVIMSNASVEVRRPFCNCLIDICRNKDLQERAHELLYLGTLFGLYPGLHNKTNSEWCLDVRSLSVGAALTALEEWMWTLTKIVQREEALPEFFLAQTGTGVHKFAQGLNISFASHLKKLAAPFNPSEEKAGCFVATREDLIYWVRSKFSSAAVAT
ncbi:pentatricopeptide repeat-containing protein At5g46580, chloroplastic [Arachis stenosperma]|uniref:pentatricopeptide repeat-containing protein At5g46580, chloroplastic n=1 Tax=Arachis stenosperma TaxID=217475 RepID=UPI0025AC5046|nr:pentatricopeptide repeat-containing protein At5g46580, chloroplastic [Arachis stenosperma]